MEEVKYLKIKSHQLINRLIQLREVKISIYDRYFTTKLSKEQKQNINVENTEKATGFEFFNQFIFKNFAAKFSFV